MGVIVMARYQPKAGKAKALRNLLKTHVQVLQNQGLATTFQPVLLKASDGSYVEVFEWVSRAAMKKAHKNAAVLAMWGLFNEACTHEPMASLAELSEPFAEFEPVHL